MLDERLELGDRPPLAHYLDDREEAEEAALRADVLMPVLMER
jgi:hypothetical protein